MHPSTFPPIAALAITCLLAPGPAHAASDLRIHYAALQRMLAEQVFSTDGRRYVKGSANDKCNYGYLEHPVIDAENGRLRVRARFTGRSALNLFGACVGMGDSFDVVITARPEFKDGAIRLTEVKAETDVRGFYAGRVCRGLAESLPAQFAYPVLDEARRAVETPVVPGYERKLKRFDVHQVAVTPEALVLSLDLDITIG